MYQVLTKNGIRLNFKGGYIIKNPTAPVLYELFSFFTTGTTLSQLRIDGASLTSANEPTWDFGDTTTGSTINTMYSKTYTGIYEDPANKEVTFSLFTPSAAQDLRVAGASQFDINKVYSIDISNFTTLRDLFIPYTEVSSLNTSNNINLRNLYIGYTNISSLNLSNNPSLMILSAGSSDLSSIDVSNNTSLTQLIVNNTNISEIDVSNNANLTVLNVGNTTVSEIDLTNNMQIQTIIANDSDFDNLILSNSTYPILQSININNCSMTSNEVNDFIDYIWDKRSLLTSLFKQLNMAGNNADLSFESVHKVVFLEDDYNFSDFGSDYNVPDNIMRFGFTNPTSNNDVSSYFLGIYGNAPARNSIYGNSITNASGDTNLIYNVYCDINLSDYQSSNVSWTLRLKYRRHSSPSTYTTVDTTTYTFTGNTSGMEFQKQVSVSLTNILGSQSFSIEYEVTLTDNRSNKNQVTGDFMILRVTSEFEQLSNTDGLIISPITPLIYNFTRTKWGA